ncbi:MAG: biotin/lipoyl-binding protein [Clostridiales bacterium]|nr:biotin/lipoyl-binding protein [Clostridiales bacterium]
MAKRYSVTVNGKVYDVTVEEIGESLSSPVSEPVKEEKPAPASAPKVEAGAGTRVEAPLNGTVLGVNVKSGDAVKAGDVLCVVEAMKMENDIVAPCDGKITSVSVQKGTSVNAGDALFTIE